MRRFPWGVIAIAIGLGCGQAPTSTPTDEVMGREQALGESGAPADAPATCDAGDLTWSSGGGVCAGPWEYERFDECWQALPAGSTAGSETSTCTQWNECANWCFGVVDGPWTAGGTRDVTVAKECRVECYDGPRGRRTCTKPICTPNVQAARDRCDEQADALASGRRTGFPDAAKPNVRARVTAVNHVSQVDTNRDRFRCTLQLQLPTPARATGSLCGCRTTTHYRPVACERYGTTGPRLWSEAGLTQAELTSDDADAYVGSGDAAPSCSSCEQLPMSTPAEVHAKFACLCDAWDRIPGVERCGGPAPSTPGTSAGPATGATQIGGLAGMVFELPNACRNDRTIRLPNDATIVDDRGPGHGALDATQIPAFARHFRLLAELRGESLSVAQRAFVDRLAATLPGVEHTCAMATSTQVPAACPAAQREWLQQDVTRCERLARAHVSSEIAAIEAPFCLGLLDRLADPAIDTACDAPALRATVRQATTTMLAKSLRLLETDPTSELASLPRQLHALSSWWEVFDASHEVDAPLALDVAPRGTLSEMLGRFWRHAHEGARVLQALRDELPEGDEDPDTAAIEGALGIAQERGLALDRAVLVAGWTPVTTFSAVVEEGVTVASPVAVDGTPLRGLPALLVLADALGRVDARLDALVELHDFACRFEAERCLGAGFESVTERWVASIARLGTPELTAERAATTVDLEGWEDVFAALDAGRATLVAALQAEGYGGFDEIGADVSPEVASLATLVLENRARRERFLADGFFDAATRRTLHGGVTPLEGANVLSRMSLRVDRVRAEQQRYDDALDTVARGLVEVAGTAQASAAIANQMDELFERIDQLRSDERGLLASAAVERLRLGDMTAELAALDDGELFQVGDSRTFPVTGTDGRFDGSQDPEAIEWAVESFVGDELGDAQMLVVETTGVYAPTCTLDMGQALVPTAAGGVHVESIPVAGAFVGPEGFVVSYVRGHQQVHSVGRSWERSHSRSETERLERCTHAGVSVEGILGPIVPVPYSLGLSARDCDVEEETYASRSSNTNGSVSSSDSRTSASFSAGLRLAYTPFPNAPAGALLAVVLPRGEQRIRQYTDVQVITKPHSTVFLPADSDVYFVVNDSSCTTADTTQSLRVTVRPMSTAGALAEAVVDAMREVVADAAELRATYSAQGTLLSSQLQLVRSTAVAQLEEAAGMPFSGLPPALQTLFHAHVDLTLVDLEREVQVASIRRQLRVAYLQLAAHREELAHVARRGRYALVVPMRHLHALPERHLGAQLHDLLVDTERFLLPVMHLWFPESTVAPSGIALQQAVEEMLEGGLGTPFSSLVARVLIVLEDALTRLTTSQAWSRPYSEHARVALTWPNPTPPPGNIATSAFRRASVMPATEMQTLGGVDPWIAVRDGGTGVFRVRPEDVYSRALGTSGVLWCHEAVPVISGMALFVGRPGSAASINESLNQQGRSVAGYATNVGFQTEEALESYEIEASVTQQFSLPLIFGQPAQALETLDRLFPAGTRHPGPVGLSPFADFVVDFSGLLEARANTSDNDGFTTVSSGGTRSFVASEMTLVFRVDTREVGEVVGGVNRCEPPLPGGDGPGDGPGDDGPGDDGPGDDGPGIPI
ncbi:MAG: hypothetical protein H6721_03845 [Sandaracinus sp.]|nr:hypothetical protein [Sandaracinus sp.]MCB9631262.1 hypothetical protein [Sandaracinus sp.]